MRRERRDGFRLPAVDSSPLFVQLAKERGRYRRPLLKPRETRPLVDSETCERLKYTVERQKTMPLSLVMKKCFCHFHYWQQCDVESDPHGSDGKLCHFQGWMAKNPQYEGRRSKQRGKISFIVSERPRFISPKVRKKNGDERCSAHKMHLLGASAPDQFGSGADVGERTSQAFSSLLQADLAQHGPV